MRYYADGPRHFHNQDLLVYVRTHIGEAIAPDSPGRILRELRQRRQLNYRVVNRRASQYEFLPLDPIYKSDLFEGERARDVS